MRKFWFTRREKWGSAQRGKHWIGGRRVGVWGCAKARKKKKLLPSHLAGMGKYSQDKGGPNEGEEEPPPKGTKSSSRGGKGKKVEVNFLPGTDVRQRA